MKVTRLFNLVIGSFITIILSSSFSSTFGDDQDTTPEIKIFSASGEIDFEEGISKNTKKIYVRIIPKEGETNKYKVSNVEVTLVYDGIGRGSKKTGSEVSLEGLSLKQNSTVVIEVKEYQEKDSKGDIRTVKLLKPQFFSIPVY